jgi:hypothetical protein
LHKELVTGREWEEPGLPSVTSSSCPLTVPRKEGQGEGGQVAGQAKRRARKSEPSAGVPGISSHRWGRATSGRGVPSLASNGGGRASEPPVPSPRTRSVERARNLEHGLDGGIFLLKSHIVTMGPTFPGPPGWSRAPPPAPSGASGGPACHSSPHVTTHPSVSPAYPCPAVHVAFGDPALGSPQAQLGQE